MANWQGFFSTVYLSKEHEPLGIGDDLAGVEGLSDVLHECLLVAGELGGVGALQHSASPLSLSLDRNKIISVFAKGTLTGAFIST